MHEINLALTINMLILFLAGCWDWQVDLKNMPLISEMRGGNSGFGEEACLAPGRDG